MDYTKNIQNPLDADIAMTAYLKANPTIQAIVSALLTYKQEESSLIFSYINNNETDNVINDKIRNNKTTLGFTFAMATQSHLAVLLINAFDVLKTVPEGKDLAKVIISGLLGQMKKEDQIEVIKKAAEYAS